MRGADLVEEGQQCVHRREETAAHHNWVGDRGERERQLERERRGEENKTMRERRRGEEEESESETERERGK